MNLSVTEEVIVNDWLFALLDTITAYHQNFTDIVLTSPFTYAIDFIRLDIDKPFQVLLLHRW